MQVIGAKDQIYEVKLIDPSEKISWMEDISKDFITQWKPVGPIAQTELAAASNTKNNNRTGSAPTVCSASNSNASETPAQNS